MMVFVRENPTKMDDLGVPPFQETSIYIYIYYDVISTINHKIQPLFQISTECSLDGGPIL